MDTAEAYRIAIGELYGKQDCLTAIKHLRLAAMKAEYAPAPVETYPATDAALNACALVIVFIMMGWAVFA